MFDVPVPFATLPCIKRVAILISVCVKTFATLPNVSGDYSTYFLRTKNKGIRLILLHIGFFFLVPRAAIVSYQRITYLGVIDVVKFTSLFYLVLKKKRAFPLLRIFSSFFFCFGELSTSQNGGLLNLFFLSFFFF